MESEPPYQYVRGNSVNLTDPTGMNPPVPNGPATPLHPTGQYPPDSIGTLYNGERQPLKDKIIELHNGWRIENNLFQEGVVRFGEYILRIAVPGMTVPTGNVVATIGPPSVTITPSSYQTILYFQGLMDVASFGENTAYRLGYPIPGNSQFARPGNPLEYAQIQTSPTGYAVYTGDSPTDDVVINGATPATTSLG